MAALDGVVVDSWQGQENHVLLLPDAIQAADRALLSVNLAMGGAAVKVVAVDSDGDGRPDSVRSDPERTVSDRLMELPIWDRTRRTWIMWSP